MGIAADKWADYECRSENGILLPSDEFVPLDGSPELGYRAGRGLPLAELLSGDGDWIEVDPDCHCRDEDEGLVAEAGGGPLEAEGFVAVKDITGRLVWILHLSDSEAFTEVSIKGGEVVAVAEEYPVRNEFRIPIAEPGRLQVRSEDIA